jgi:hypothetical protein
VEIQQKNTELAQDKQVIEGMTQKIQDQETSQQGFQTLGGLIAQIMSKMEEQHQSLHDRHAKDNEVQESK